MKRKIKNNWINTKDKPEQSCRKNYMMRLLNKNKKLRREVRLQGYDIDLYKYPEYCKN